MDSETLGGLVSPSLQLEVPRAAGELPQGGRSAAFFRNNLKGREPPEEIMAALREVTPHPGRRQMGPRPLNVFVRTGSKAELVSRRRAAGRKLEPRVLRTRPEDIAAGFTPRPDLNLVDQGGKIIQDLVFTNFYVGADGWDPADMQNIDSSLTKAMSDPHLNNVMLQYFRGAAAITSTFQPSQTLPDHPNTISQTDVESLVTLLQGQGQFNGFDLGNTVFNFMLARGIVLTIDDGSGQTKGGAKAQAGADDASSSLEGLGGFHGSVHVGGNTIYYAVGVFSEGNNGIVAFDQSWKNVVATFYHELNEARTDADVEDNAVAWVTNESPSEEIGDIPMSLAGADLSKVMQEVPLADGSGTVPIQLMWSNAVAGPEGPIDNPH